MKDLSSETSRGGEEPRTVAEVFDRAARAEPVGRSSGIGESLFVFFCVSALLVFLSGRIPGLSQDLKPVGYGCLFAAAVAFIQTPNRWRFLRDLTFALGFLLVCALALVPELFLELIWG